MRTRTAVALSASLALAAGSFAPALAAPKPKPIKKTYTASAPTPDPTPFVGENCDPTLDSAKHEAPFTVPYAGVLTVKVHGFQGDWALALLDKDGEIVASHDNDATSEPVDSPSEVVVKFKKKANVIVRACNFAGGPTATVDISLVPK